MIQKGDIVIFDNKHKLMCGDSTIKEDVEKFKKGLYSQFSDDYKEQILTFWDIEKTENVFEGILYKTEIGKKFAEEENNSDDEKAEGEYWPKPNMEIEQFSNMY